MVGDFAKQIRFAVRLLKIFSSARRMARYWYRKRRNCVIYTCRLSDWLRAVTDLCTLATPWWSWTLAARPIKNECYPSTQKIRSTEPYQLVIHWRLVLGERDRRDRLLANSACSRNTFIIGSVDGSCDRRPLRYGERFRLESVASSNHCLNSEHTRIVAHSRSSSRQGAGFHRVNTL